MVYVKRRETFSAAHRLYNPAYSDEKNLEIFGKCSNPNWHGHNYVLEVTVAGEPDPETGFVIDLKILKNIINENILAKVDHKNLNTETDFMKGIIPSAENIAKGIFNELKDKMPSGRLYSVVLFETEKNIVEYRGE
jgi:6-pyruvoyltetrahydropterin/6-carboxytetrahydropterin synthase